MPKRMRQKQHNRSMKKNALIFGCGSKFGLSLTTELQNRDFLVYGISSSTENSQVLKINWNNCFINDFEKFLRSLPKIDLIIFNQNLTSVTDNYWRLNSLPILDIWKQSKQWMQSHYVNCILPTHVLHTLTTTGHIGSMSQIVWMLSRSMFGKRTDLTDYRGQKYQNYINMQQFAKNNPQKFIGVCPGHLDVDIYQSRAQKLIDLLMQHTLESGQFFAFDHINATFKPYEEIQS